MVSTRNKAPPRALRRLVGLALGLFACAPAASPEKLPERWPQPLVSNQDLRWLARPSPVGDTPICQASLRLQAALPDPTAVSDAEGEWIELIYDGLGHLDLNGWSLESGRRIRTFDSYQLVNGKALRVGAAEALNLGSLRLRNRRGEVRLRDPCGVVVMTLRWGISEELGPGTVIIAPAPWHDKHIQRRPTRTHPSGAPGGYGQT